MLFVVFSIAACSAFVHTIPAQRKEAAKTVIFKHVANANKADKSSSWSEETRNEAANALLPVLFPKFNNNTSADPIAAETSLKKLLRSRYRRYQANNHTTTGDAGQIATLVLGTSVMRLRHWYVVALSREKITPPIPYPFDASLLSLLPNCTDDEAVSQHEQYSEYELLFAKEMVDEHIRYILGTKTDVSPLNQSTDIKDLATKLSLEYSMPLFLTDSLLRHYGYTTTQEIFLQSNAPGPITLRKNSIRFPRSDDEFCQYIMDQDRVHAVPLRTSKSNGSADVTQLALCQSSDGHSRYKVGEHIKPGTILAPNGCIRILESDNTPINTSVTKLSKSIWSMKAWQQGYFEVQDVGSQIIVQSIEAEPGDSILDYCAGNGGKTFGIASTLIERSIGLNYSSSVSRIVAHDIVDERLRQIKGSMSRVGFTKEDDKSGLLTFSTTNTSHACCKISIATSDQLQTMKSTKKFDIVLVDAPCSSTGVLRRRPSQRWSLQEKEVLKDLPELQLKILKEAAMYVKRGGKLVYSTCSLLREENENVVGAFEESDVYRGVFERWNFDTVCTSDDDGCNSSESQNTLTILPSENGDGFFIARCKSI